MCIVEQLKKSLDPDSTWDIVKLGEEMLAIGKPVLTNLPKLTLPMLARYAFLVRRDLHHLVCYPLNFGNTL
jgi:hypothetical protein